MYKVFFPNTFMSMNVYFILITSQSAFYSSDVNSQELFVQSHCDNIKTLQMLYIDHLKLEHREKLSCHTWSTFNKHANTNAAWLEWGNCPNKRLGLLAAMWLNWMLFVHCKCGCLRQEKVGITVALRDTCNKYMFIF